MTLSKGMTRFGTVLAVAALLVSMSMALATAAQAQVPPASYYGGGATEGDEIGAWIDGVECGTATVDAAGEWVIFVEADAPCAPTEGATVSFSVNGVVQAETETWTGGGLPTDVANGITFTGPGEGGVTPPATGDAGLLGGSASTPWLALGLGVIALAVLAGSRAATNRSR